MKKTIQSTGFALMCLFATWGCSPDAITNYAEEEIVAEQGGVVVTENGITLEIPAGAFEEDGVVFVGKTGEEPTTVPNPDLTVVGEPFTLKLPVDTLLAPLTLSFPLPDADITNNNGIVMLYNGTSYYPFEYEIVDGKVVVSIDTINWEQITTKGVILGPLIAITTSYLVNINDDYLGIKEVSVVSGKVEYKEPASINSSSKILLFVHGLIGDPTGWEEYVKKIYQEPDRLSYTNIWTFGYDSDTAIDVRGGELKRLLEQKLNGQKPTIHIVAHSMGGLVSRSMIENHEDEGASLVHKLITLSTPHLGSPIEILRLLLGMLTEPATVPIMYHFMMTFANDLYKYNTQAAKDLGEDSKFIESLKELAKPPIPYYTIACKNNGRSIFENFFDSPHDGIVSVRSAKGVQGAESPSYDVTIPLPIAHMSMRTFPDDNNDLNAANEELYAQVKEFLQKNEQEESGTITDYQYGKAYACLLYKSPSLRD